MNRTDARAINQLVVCLKSATKALREGSDEQFKKTWSIDPLTAIENMTKILEGYAQ